MTNIIMTNIMAPSASALVLVDIQNDFCPGGALAVPQGDGIIPIVNRLAPLFGFVAATQDWHPPNHISFKDQGGDWPPHCIQGTFGAQLHPGLEKSNIDLVVKKAFSPERDVFEGLEAVDTDAVKLDVALRQREISNIYVVGLATDYCVRSTVLDALDKGYEVYAIVDAMRAVDVRPDDGARALEEMDARGAHLVTSAQVLGAAALSSSAV
jgi:nicotinamidase/pyrazinamidase